MLPAVALALALVPSALGAPPQAEAPATPAPQALPDPDPTRLALAPPDLLADALRVGFERRFAALEASPAPVSSPPPEAPETATLLGPELAVAASVPEPPSVWLGLLSLASAAVASRGTPRCPRRRRHR